MRTIRLLLLALLILVVPVASFAQFGVSIMIAPPALPIYTQPMCPSVGYMWTPGYWAYGDDGYFWVPGTWVMAPEVGFLWTPGYWGWGDNGYAWNEGYWGPHVGFYGGINYGFGYGGVGFAGGEWRGGAFFYNRAVMNVNVTNITNVYSRTVIVNNTHVAFNGPGGIEARPTSQEEAYGRESHTAALSTQMEHERAASQNRALFASENHGRPEVAATARPGDFSGRGVVRASAAGEAYHEPKVSPQEARGSSRGGSSRDESARNGGNSKSNSNERAMARQENRDAGNREQKTARENSNHNSKPSKQEKQAQKKAQKQAKAEQKRNPEER